MTILGVEGEVVHRPWGSIDPGASPEKGGRKFWGDHEYSGHSDKLLEKEQACGIMSAGWVI